METAQEDIRIATHERRHLRFGWWSLLVFVVLGLVLETLHGFKIPFYLNTENETRRLLWRLAHAHGGLLSIIHITFAVSVARMPSWNPRWRSLASPCLVGASILLPAGFFFGGLVFYQGDPGYFILLVPLGALLLIATVLLVAIGTGTLAKGRRSSPGKRKSE